MADIANEIVAAYLVNADRQAVSSGGWRQDRPGVTATVTGLPYASYNAVFVQGAQADLSDLDALIDAVEASGLPGIVRTRPVADPALIAHINARGYGVESRLPLMSLDPADYVRPDAEPPPIRLLQPDQPRIHIPLVAEALESPLDVIDAFMSPERHAAGRWRIYIGEVDGDLAVTGSAVPCADHVCLIAIATDTGHRRKGYAAALNARMIDDAFAGGARRVFLHASEMGRGMYEAMGFRFVEDWSMWARAE
ncbi:MAG: GNAT family N-acetyltransferase [Pseudomonadota bacterium]